MSWRLGAEGLFQPQGWGTSSLRSFITCEDVANPRSQRRLTPAGLSACHWRGRLPRSSTRALGVPGRASEGKQLLGLHARGCRHPQTGLPPSVPQKDVRTCSPRWLHSPAGEERAKAWASDKGQSSTLVAEGPQGFRPTPPPFSAGPQGPGELPSPLSDAAVTIYPSLKGQSRAAASSRPPASARGTVLAPSSPPGGTSIPRLATPDLSCWCFPRDLEEETACALPSGSVFRRGLVRRGLCLLSQAPTFLCKDRGVGASSQSGPGRLPLASAPGQHERPPLPQSPRFRSKQRVDRGCWNPRGRT